MPKKAGLSEIKRVGDLSFSESKVEPSRFLRDPGCIFFDPETGYNEKLLIGECGRK